MYSLTYALVVLATASQVVALPQKPLAARGSEHVPVRRYTGPPASYVTNSTRTDAVKQTFQISWDGYYKYAFPGDSLLPVTNGASNDRNGWGASAVDAFSTALIMDNEPVWKDILDFVPTIDFSVSANGSGVSLFETTIRYLGGLLSAYDLLTGPEGSTKYSNASATADKVLTQAKNLADNLAFAFDTETGIPDNLVYLSPPRRANSTSNGLATIGTLVMEWTRLSDITGNTTYGELAQKGESYLINPVNPAIGEPFPGLLGSVVRISDGMFFSGKGGWTGGTDSYYEYLIKMYLYDPERFAVYKDRWVDAANSSIKYLASHPTSRPDLTFLAYYESRNWLEYKSEHLACFDGGNFILGGLTLDEPRFVDFGLELVAGCRDTYTQTATGIGPESFQWVGEKSPANDTVPAADQDFYARAGYYITGASYITRPEVIESYYYAYRATGDPMYQEWAWEAYLAINSTCRVGSGYSSIKNVDVVGGGGFSNFQESFWFAEVLKYSYLIHSEDSPYQFKADHSNEYVFNTEAHPIRIPGGESTKKVY